VSVTQEEKQKRKQLTELYLLNKDLIFCMFLFFYCITACTVHQSKHFDILILVLLLCSDLGVGSLCQELYKVQFPDIEG